MLLLLFSIVSVCRAWQLSLTQEELDRGVAYRGSGLGAVLDKLRASRSTTVSAVGGSITHGHGAGPGAQPDHGGTDLSHGHPGWSRLAFDYVQEAWPGNHTYTNGAVPATGSDFFSLCVERHVHRESDVVFMEFSVNDAGGADAGVLQQQELVIRRLRRMLPDAALVFVHFWNHFPERNDPLWEPEWFVSPEVQTTALAQYYDVTSLSLRNAVLPSVLGGIRQTSDFAQDRSHPLGHKMLADLFVHALSSPPQRPAAGYLPPPLVPGNDGAPNTCRFGRSLAPSSGTSRSLRLKRPDTKREH